MRSLRCVIWTAKKLVAQTLRLVRALSFIAKNLNKLHNNCVQVSLAKPPSDKKKKEEILRARERRMMQMMQGRTGAVG